MWEPRGPIFRHFFRVVPPTLYNVPISLFRGGSLVGFYTILLMQMQMQMHTVQTLRLDRLNSHQRRDTEWHGVHSFTCHPHVYPRMEWAILHAFSKHSPDGVARVRWRTSGSTYYSSIGPERRKGWVGLGGWLHTEIKCRLQSRSRTRTCNPSQY